MRADRCGKEYLRNNCNGAPIPESRARWQVRVYMPSQEVARAVYKHIEGEVGPAFGVSVALLQGELGADLKLLAANIIVSSATHWDMVSRRWKQRKHIQNVDLYIADELHLLGARDGPVFEVVLSRARYVASQLERPCRIVGLSALVTNAKDIGDWLGVPQKAFFNFAGAGIRQVPLEVSLFGFDNNYANARLPLACQSTHITHVLR